MRLAKLLRHATAVAVVATLPLSAQRPDTPVELPARVIAGRFYVHPVTERGDTLTLFTDTGGGLWLASDVVARLGLPTCVEGVQGSDTTRSVTLPAFRVGATIPGPLGQPDQRLFVVPGMSAIQVPHISVAGFDVGPVWFTQRPDRSFHSYMAQWMDKPTDGALGGSALQYFRVTVDYPNGIAVFAR